MAQLGDAIVQFPVSGSSSGSAGAPPAIFVRMVQQVSQVRNYVIAHPGGSMTGSLLLAPQNNNRLKFFIINSGTLALGINRGSTFNPTQPMTLANHYDNVIQGTVVLQGNQGSTPSLGFYSEQPVYTGPIYASWIGSGSLSGSVAIFTEFEG